MRKPLLLCALLLTLLPGRIGAMTLDGSHALWSRPGTDRERWVRAIEELHGQQVPGPKWHLPAAARGRVSAVGRRVLVIPVLPADAAAPPVSREDLVAAFAGPGENSLRGYWDRVSAGELELEVLVLPWLPVPGTLASDYVNVIDGNPGNLVAGPRRLAHDAVTAAARLVDDLHVFDDDGPDGVPGSGDDDGVLDLVVVLHPFEGFETDPDPPSRSIVSLQARLGDEAVPIEGTDLRADGFVVASALGPLGVWVHEFGHLLGLPDLYELDRSVEAGTPGGPAPMGGLGRWSLMASGTWGGGGALPSGLDAWSRSTLGFGEEVEVAGAETAGLEWVGETSAPSLRIHPLGDWVGESFLVEARRARPGAVVDADLPGSGALVYRLLPGLSDNRSGGRFLSLLQADGRDDIGDGSNDGDATDPFDGSAGRDRLDATTDPSSESATPSPARTPPALVFRQRGAGMEVEVDLDLGANLRLEALGVEDDFLGTRAWLRPGESGTLVLRLADVGATAATSGTVEIEVLATGRTVAVEPTGPVELVREEGALVPGTTITISDPPGDPAQGVAQLRLHLVVDGAVTRTVDVDLPVTFSGGLPPDALARFTPEIGAAPQDTTRFARLDVADLPLPAFVGYELRTNGEPGYANGVETSLVSPSFGVPGEPQAWLWSRGSTEQGLPGQVFDGAAIEVYYPDHGWQPLVPEGPPPVWISRRSTAATRDRLGFGGDQPQWDSWSVRLPRTDLPARVRIRFASDGSVAGGSWQVAGLQTTATPHAEIRLDTGRSNSVIAVARLSGDFSRVNLANYRYREGPFDPWKPASGNFTIIGGTETLNIVLSLLPADLRRAEIALFSGLGESAYVIGSTGFRRAPAPRLPRLVRNPAFGRVVLQLPDLDEAISLSVYDLRGRRRAGLRIPAHTTWMEWEPRSDGGALLSSGQYFLRADGTDPGSVRFTWLR